MFLLEICILVVLAYWGFHNSAGILAKCLFGIGTPLLVATLWGIFAAPRSNRRLTLVNRIIFALLLFLTSGLLLYQTGQTTYAIVFMIAAVVSQILVFVFEE